jgi:hypothetical protein
MIEAVNQTDELKNYHRAFGGEYDILGLKVKTKTMNLQLQKETCVFIGKLMAHVYEITGFKWGEAKEYGEQFLCAMAMLGFLAREENLAESLTLFVQGDTDWKRFIENNRDCYDMILDTAVTIVSNFFLSTGKFIIKRVSY